MTSTSTSTTTNEHLAKIKAHGELIADTLYGTAASGLVVPDVDVMLHHAAAMAARIERYDAALRAAASYIDLLDKGKGPSDPAYLPLRDCYRNAVEDLGDAQNDGSNGR